LGKRVGRERPWGKDGGKLLERGMVPKDTVSLVALSVCKTALAGTLSRRLAAAANRAVHRSIVDDVIFAPSVSML